MVDRGTENGYQGYLLLSRDHIPGHSSIYLFQLLPTHENLVFLRFKVMATIYVTSLDITRALRETLVYEYSSHGTYDSRRSQSSVYFLGYSLQSSWVSCLL